MRNAEVQIPEPESKEYIGSGEPSEILKVRIEQIRQEILNIKQEEMPRARERNNRINMEILKKRKEELQKEWQDKKQRLDKMREYTLVS